MFFFTVVVGDALKRWNGCIFAFDTCMTVTRGGGFFSISFKSLQEFLKLSLI